MQSKLDMAGKKPPKAFILPVATICLTFVIGLLFIAMPLADAVKGDGDVAELKKSIHRLNESMFSMGTTLLERLKLLEGKAGNSQNQTGQVEGMTGESQGLTGYMKKMVEEFQKQTEHMKKMTGKVEDMTGQMKWITHDAVEDLLMKAGGCPLPWLYHDRGCYLFVDEKKNWNDAKKYCIAKGGHLASVHTKTTHDFFYGLAEGRETWTWVGGYKEGGEWKWVDGSTFNVKTYGEAGSKDARWAPGEPNNLGGNEGCVEIWTKGGLNDFLCYYQQPFICQK
ncbi:C-type lectin domain family 10 member A-like [Dunckerocampus dactyliophorus]|uniref:C-type lectin domain family 10 member A-like n=1 Tax=Dunckerocampus dactyliophorus TaxID=161453 RepID=UPI0024061698|nr:C-type lectin domain family 10 member A-like [Dunckerocampus dactyliophorus]